MSLPTRLRSTIEERFGPITGLEQLPGGCIANATRVRAGGEDLFVKFSTGESGATFEAEAAGLKKLASANEQAEGLLVIPDILAVANSGTGPGYLVQEYLPPSRPIDESWRRLGRGLAQLHHAKASDCYGFHSDNFIGRLPQHNAWTERWPAFFKSQRLEPQVSWAREWGLWQAEWDAPLDSLYHIIEDILPETPHPATLHGDLWTGNVLHTERGPALVDPATYFGDAESDLAMADLFGGFPTAFFSAYHEVNAEAPGASRRRVLYQLYHLINHSNHFGVGYAGQVGSALRALTRNIP